MTMFTPICYPYLVVIDSYMHMHFLNKVKWHVFGDKFWIPEWLVFWDGGSISWSALLLINPFISFISSQPCVLSQKWVLELEWGTNLRILIEVVLQIIDQHSTCFFYVTSAWCHHKRTWYHWTTTTISVSSFYNALFWLIFSWPQAEFVVGKLIIGLTFRATYMIVFERLYVLCITIVGSFLLSV